MVPLYPPTPWVRLVAILSWSLVLSSAGFSLRLWLLELVLCFVEVRPDVAPALVFFLLRRTNCAGFILPLVLFLDVQSAVSVRCVTAFRPDVVVLMDVELLLLLDRSG